MLSSLSACANLPLQKRGTLTAYTGMAASGGMQTKAELRVDSEPVLAAKTARIVPTSVEIAGDRTFSAEDLALISNTIDRTLCSGLSDRFTIVASEQPADLTVHATVTDIVPTNRVAAATSTVASLGASVALPVPIPRIPVGLGGLSVEAEALGADGSQDAAMLWARGANALTGHARYSAVGDAYSLSSAFAGDFSRMLVKGADPFKGLPALPSMQRVRVSLGGSPKYDACKAFGSAPGLWGAVTGELGLPPSVADKGAKERP